MSGERFHIAAYIIVKEWLQTTDPTRDITNIHLTNEDLLVELIAKELENEHDNTIKNTIKKGEE